MGHTSRLTPAVRPNKCLFQKTDSIAPPTSSISADSSGILCKWFVRFRMVMLMHPLLDLVGAQLSIGLDDGALAMQPLRLDRVQPRRLDRQVAHPDLAAPLPLDLAVVCPDPAPHPLAGVPGRVVPDQHEHPL